MKEKIRRFMAGRYCTVCGADSLTWALIGAYIVVGFAADFIPGVILRTVLRILSACFAVFAIYRLFSKKHYSRARENRLFLQFFRNVKNFFKLQFDRIKNVKTKRYRKCPECKAVLQLPVPKEAGKHTVVCPKCGKRFSVFNLF